MTHPSCHRSVWAMALACALLACGEREGSAPRPPSADPRPAAEHAHGHEPHAAHHEASALEGEAARSDRSLYQLEGEWTDASGRSVPLSLHRGQPVLALLFYGTCEHACPVLVRRLHEIEAALDPALRSNVRFLLVTFDPERDTPERLAEYAQEEGLDAERWTLLQGTSDRIRELALVLGVRYRQTKDGEFSHTQRISLLDAEGVVVEHLDGLASPVEPLAARLAALLEAPPAS